MNMRGVGGFGGASWLDDSEPTGLDRSTRDSIIELAQALLRDFRYYKVELTDIEDRIRHGTHPDMVLQKEFICYLITHPNAINEPIAQYVSAGDFAAQKGLSGLYRILTRFPEFDYDKPDRRGNTQLHHAAGLLSDPIVGHIIDMGKAHSKANRSGESPLDYLTLYAERANPGKRQAMMQKLIAAGVEALNPHE